MNNRSKIIGQIIIMREKNKGENTEYKVE